MKRILIISVIFMLLLGCTGSKGRRYTSTSFDATLPEHFERVSNSDIICFAPYGEAVRSSSITYYATELNWYFDTFSDNEYETALCELTGYDSLTLVDIQPCRVDGCRAYRIACKVGIDQGLHDLILYAIESDKTYFFTLLNRDSDSYIGAFDDMMRTIRLKGTRS